MFGIGKKTVVTAEDIEKGIHGILYFGRGDDAKLEEHMKKLRKNYLSFEGPKEGYIDMIKGNLKEIERDPDRYLEDFLPRKP